MGNNEVEMMSWASFNHLFLGQPFLLLRFLFLLLLPECVSSVIDVPFECSLY
jgi:hypothetical protein